MSFENLKKQSKLGSLTERLVKEVEKMNTASGADDDRFWKPSLGKGDTGSAVIRFLPAPEGEDLPWVKMYSHAFQGPTGLWYIENSRTTIGDKDPVGEYNRKLWASGSEADKEVVRKQKRKLSYYSNIYVIKDPVNPENEGKVKLFKYGKKIFDKIMGAMQPEFDDEDPINPFDLWSGANFRLKITKKDGYWNYDKSEFALPEPLMDDDDAMEAIWKKEYSLATFTSTDQFKPYEQLQKRLNDVLGLSSPAQKIMRQEEELESYVSEEVEEVTYTPRRPVTQTTESEDEDDDNSAMAYFQKLIDED